MGKSNISYLDYVWSPVTGCSGNGCKAHCYARYSTGSFPAIHGKAIPFSQVVLHEDRLREPSKWKKPRVIGVGFFGDLFDVQVEANWIHSVLHQAELAPQHTYVFLTKQPAKMANMICNHWDFGGDRFPNWWLGTTICDQDEADERVPEILRMNGNTWVSYEPALGEVTHIPGINQCQLCGGVAYYKDGNSRWCEDCGEHYKEPGLVVVGCESGAKRRPMPMSWPDRIVRLCGDAEIPCYVKQLDLNGTVSKAPVDWPGSLRVQELPWRERA